jgi:uncharacterized membrane protein YjgN (DUF898 family)
MSIAHHEAPAAPPTTPSDGGSHTISAPYESVPRQLLIEFTGSGGEYFRIWIVNLLLTLVTLGLYLPWAKVRRLRYFYSNTLIDSDPLHFHGAPLQMFKGFVIVVVGFVLYSVAGEFSPTAGFLAFLVVAALWPLLFRSSMCFRLSNTSWRGLRFAFSGSTKQAYLAWLPLFFPSIALLTLSLLAPAMSDPDPDHKMAWFNSLALGLIVFASIAVVPWLLYRLKYYQHQNYRFSTEATVFTTKLKDYYWTTLKCLGTVLLAYICLVVFLFIFFFGFFSMGTKFEELQNNIPSLIFFGLSMIALGALFYSLATPYIVTRFQNLVWSGTRSEHLQFTSTLGVAPMMALSVKNWLLMLLTLGLYWPYAKVAMTRLRLESVQLASTADPAQWTAASSLAQGSAMGDASGDFFGFDVGL